MRLAEGASSSVPAAQPYLGLRPYTEEEQDSFFGRNRERRLLIDKILANKLTLLFAASGVGKSSLLRAAVLPHLRHPKQENLDAIYYSDWVSNPLDGLKSATLAELQKRGRLDEQVSVQDMDAESLKDFFQLEALFTRHPLVIVLDQFEEFFQYQRYAEDFTPFIQQLSDAIRDNDTPIAVVISMREDFALELNAFKAHLPTLLFGNFYRLERLTVDCARQAIVEPVQSIGFHYEEELLETMLKDLSTRELRHTEDKPLPELLDTVEPPYLQIVCSQLWELSKHDPAKTIALSTYRKAGSAGGLLNSYVESVVAEFSPAEKSIASRCFDHLASHRGTKIAYTVLDLARTVDVKALVLEPVLRRLEKARILRSQSREDIVWYELYHDLFTASVSEWNRKYKAGQRNKRAVLMAMGFSVMAFLLYAAYNFGVNSTSYHLRLSSGANSSQVELYRGKEGSRDLFGLHRYVAQTGYRREQLEPDKQFESKPVGSIRDLDVELIENLTRLHRLEHYLHVGRLDKAQRLAKMYLSGSDQNRARAVVEILESFPSRWSIEILASHLESEPPIALQENIVEALGRLDSPETREALLALLDKDGVQPRATAAALRVLAQLDEPRAVPIVLRKLHHSNASISAAAAVALSRMRNLQILTALEQQLESGEARMRFKAAEQLGGQGTKEAGAALTAHLGQESDVGVRVAVIKSLARLDYDVSAPLLSRLLSEDESPRVRAAAAQALGQFNRFPDGADVVLINALGDASKEVRAAASGALEKAANEALVPALLARVQELDREKAVELVDLLEKLGDPRAVPVLIGQLRSGNPALRRAATRALGRLGDPRAVPVLAQSLDVVDKGVREEVESALVSLKHPSATRVLVERLRDPRRDVRLRFATLLLKKRGDPQAAEAVLRLLADPDQFLRSGLAQMIGAELFTSDLDLAAAAMVLTSMLEEPRWFARSNAMFVFWLSTVGRSTDWQGLDTRTRVSTVDAIRRQLNDENPLDNGQPMTSAENLQRLRFNAIGALASLGDANGVRLLLDTQVSDDWTVLYRDFGSQLLDQIPGSAEMARVLASQLQEMAPDLRSRVIKLLDRWADRIDETATDDLRAYLSHPDPEVRTSIVSILGRGGQQDVASDIIGQLERDEHPEVTLSLIEAVKKMHLAAAGPALVARLLDVDARVREAAARALGELDVQEARPALADSLKDEDEGVRLAAALALGTLGDQQVLAVLIESLASSEHADEGLKIVGVLSRYSQPEIVSALVKALDEPSLRQTAAQALAQNGTPEAIEALLEGGELARISRDTFATLDSPAIIEGLIRRLNNPEVSVRRAAVQALAPLKEPSAVPGLIGLLEDKDAAIRSTAMDALARLRVTRAFLLLTSNLRSPTAQVRLAAVKALGGLGERKAVAPLMELLSSQDVAMHSAALTALGELGDARVLPFATADLRHESAQVRVAAAGVLGKLCDRDGVLCDDGVHAVLLDLLNDEDKKVVPAAVRALGQLGSGAAVDRLVLIVASLEQSADGSDRSVRREALLALGRIGGSKAADAVEGTYVTSPDLPSAMTLLMLDRSRPLEFLHAQIQKADDKARLKIAADLGNFPSAKGVDLLLGLLDDANSGVRRAAVRSLGSARAEGALPRIHDLLGEPDIALRMAAVESMGKIAMSESIVPLRELLHDQGGSQRLRLAALMAMSEIDPDLARENVRQALEADDEALGATGFYLISDGTPDALSFMSKRLDAAALKYQQSRVARNSASESRAHIGDEAFPEGTTETAYEYKWLYELGYCVATLAPDQGVELLSHDLVDVRMGAAAGLSSIADVELLQRLVTVHGEMKLPLFRSSVYQAITRTLKLMEASQARDQLDSLESLVPVVADDMAVKTRLEWTIAQLATPGI